VHPCTQCITLMLQMYKTDLQLIQQTAVCLLKIRDVIHLFPMWSAALQRNVERFAEDSTADGDDQESATGRTNSAVESHFRTVKHGRVQGRTRVRPRAFVTAELTYILGKLNERKLPKVKLRTTEAASTEEKWRRRKRTARYADAAVASKLLKNIHRRMKPKDKSTDIFENPATTVEEVTPSVDDVQMKELGDQEIMTAMDHLHAVYPDIDGLQPPGLGACVVGKSMPRYQAVVRPFLQVLNIGDHWITATNKLSRSSGNVYLFDSAHTSITSPSTIMQLSSLLRRHTDRDSMTIIHRACPRQLTTSRLCGYYALAAAYAICSGSDPTGRDYDAQTMVDVIDRNLRTGRVDQVPSATQGPVETRMRETTPKLHCRCHRPSASKMIECSNCGNWFHVNCVSVTTSQLRRLSATWNGPCCSQPVIAPPVYVSESSSHSSTTLPDVSAEDPSEYRRLCDTIL